MIQNGTDMAVISGVEVCGQSVHYIDRAQHYILRGGLVVVQKLFDQLGGLEASPHDAVVDAGKGRVGEVADYLVVVYAQNGYLVGHTDSVGLAKLGEAVALVVVAGHEGRRVWQ